MSEHSLTNRIRAKRMPPEQRRKSIVAVAIPLLAWSGESLVVSEVATAAGVAESTVFKVFPTRDSLIQACLESATETQQLVASLVKSRDQPETDPIDELTTIAIYLRDYFLNALRITMAVGSPKANDLALGTKHLLERVDALIEEEFQQRPAILELSTNMTAFEVIFISTTYSSASRELAGMKQPPIGELIQELAGGSRKIDGTQRENA